MVDRVCPPLPTPGVTLCRSDGACRGQGTIAETLAGWGAAVWSADDRGLGTERVASLEMIIPTTKLKILLCFMLLALRLQDSHLIFKVDSKILAKQLARHTTWDCRSENLIALHHQCVHVCDSLSALSYPS